MVESDYHDRDIVKRSGVRKFTIMTLITSIITMLRYPPSRNNWAGCMLVSMCDQCKIINSLLWTIAVWDSAEEIVTVSNSTTHEKCASTRSGRRKSTLQLRESISLGEKNAENIPRSGRINKQWKQFRWTTAWTQLEWKDSFHAHLLTRHPSLVSLQPASYCICWTKRGIKVKGIIMG